jgi:hypothetical protein
MDLDRKRPEDREHARRWRRNPFAPVGFRRPSGRPDAPGDRGPRDPRPRGDGAAGSERPPGS